MREIYGSAQRKVALLGLCAVLASPVVLLIFAIVKKVTS
jgi:hypothetical protein